MKIGLFDSGLGGLTILQAVVGELPHHDYEYYGDTAHLPYGDKSEQQIYDLTKTGVEHLFRCNCALVIIACNTASAETLRRLQDEYLPNSQYAERKILGVIIPVVEELVEGSGKRMLLVATSRTVSSGKYHLELGKRQDIKNRIEAVAMPELVRLIEARKTDEAVALVQDEIKNRAGEVDGLILGCTHYTLMKNQLRSQNPENFVILSQDEIIPRKVREYLENHSEIKNQLTRTASRNIFLTEQKDSYNFFIDSILGRRK